MNNFTRSNTTSFWQSVTNLTCCSIDFSKMKSMKVVMVLMLFAFTLGPVLAQGSTRTVEPIDACLPDVSEGQPLPDFLLGMTDQQIQDAFGPECVGDKSELNWTRTPVPASSNTNCDWAIDLELLVTCTDTDTDEVTVLADLKFQFSGGDKTPPVISCPADAVVECGDSTEPSATGEATADDCSGVTIDYSDSSEKGCGNSEVITRTWTAVDECGNSSSCVQIITVEDKTPPVINCPADITVECTNSTDPTATGEATATDNCGDVQISFSDSSVPGCGNTETITRTWTATDECGNSSSCVQTIEVVDTTAPNFDVEPSSPVVECGPRVGKLVQSWIATNGGASASDTCGDVQWAKPVVDFVPGCGESGVYYGKFTVYDACGNMNYKEATFTVKDDTPPSFDTEPSSPVVECGPTVGKLYQNWIGTNGGASASDTCGDVQWAKPVVDFEPGCGESGVYYATFKVYDACGNMNSVDATFTVEDTTPPVIDCPADITVECGDSTEPSATGEATGSDICGDVQITFSDSVVEDCGNTQVITRTWTATDACGLKTSCDQIITVEDKTPPSITCPVDAVVECGDSTDPADTGEATGSDICGDVLITFSDSIKEECGNTMTITRTWTATDECGLTTSCDQIIEVVDTTPPSISCPQDATVECGDSTDPADTGVATGSDICGGVTIDYSDSVVENCGLTKVITRTWTATDDCGLKSSCDQIITVIDTTPPTQTGDLPENGNELPLCLDEIPEFPESEIFEAFEDSCGIIHVELDEENSSIVGDDCNWAVMYKYYIKDDCGNYIEDGQGEPLAYKLYYQGGDQEAPELVGVPADLNLDCTEEVPDKYEANVTGTDNCDDDVEVTVEDKVIRGECTGSYVIERTWTAKDDCPETADTTATQIITVTDSTAPVSDGTVFEGDNLIDACMPDEGADDFEQQLLDLGVPTADEVGATYYDECNSGVNVIREINITGDDCDWIMWVRYTIVDDCDNDTFFKLWYEGGDETPPLQVDCFEEEIPLYTEDGADCPADATIGLTVGQEIDVNTVWYVAGLQAGSLAPCFTDNCAAVEDLTFKVTSVDNGDSQNTCLKELTVVFDVYDECMNVTKDFVCKFVVIDNTKPNFTSTPPPFDDMILECGDELPVYDVTANDACQGEIIPEYSERSCDGQGDEVDPNHDHSTNGAEEGCFKECIKRTWKIKDGCGNQRTKRQYIYFYDTEAPVLDCPEGGELDSDPTEAKDIAGFTTLGSYNGKFYYLSDQGIAGAAVFADALANNGYAVTINDEAENDWIHAAVVNATDNADAQYWIGYSDMGTEGDFQWQDGDPSAYENWYAGEPNNFNPGEDMAMVGFFSQDRKAWNDWFCDEIIPYVLELDMPLVESVPYADSCDGSQGETGNYQDSLYEAPKVYVTRLLSSEADFSGNETHINFDNREPNLDNEIVDGLEYASQGVAFSSPSNLRLIDALDWFSAPWEANIYNSARNVFAKQESNIDTPLVIDFSGPINRIGFYLATNNSDDVTISVQCFMNNSELGEEFVVTDLTSTFFGIESSASFDRIEMRAVGGSNDLIVMDDLRFEGGGTEFTLDRTFSQADACGNVGECTVSYTWCEPSLLPPYDDNQVENPFSPEDIDDLRGLELDFTAYPVPFDREVNIKYNFEFDTDIQIDVFDTKGLLIMSEKHDNYSKNMNATTKLDLSRGGDQVFYITVTTNRGSVTKKIVSNTLKRR